MKLKYESGRISFDLDDLFRSVEPERKRELVESLSCDDDLITFVGQQIIDKWTENGCYSGVSCIATPDHLRGLDKVWRDVAKASGDVAKREIERLEDALRRERARCDELVNENETIKQGQKWN